MTTDTIALFVILEWCVQSFTTNSEASCEFILDSLSQIREIIFYSWFSLVYE